MKKMTFRERVEHCANNCLLSVNDILVLARKPSDSEPLGDAIYFLIRESEIVYVGISNNVDRRLLQHKKSGKPFDGYYATTFYGDLSYIFEMYYVNLFSPEYNLKIEPVHEFLESYYPEEVYRMPRKIIYKEATR